MSDVAYGEEPDPEDPYALAIDDLTPSKSLDRIAANARSTVGTVGLVGTVVSGFGFVSLSRVGLASMGAWLVLIAVAISAVALILSLVYLTLRVDKLSIGNLDAVQAYIDAQFRRAWLPALSGWLLITSLLAGGVGATLLVAEGSKDRVSTQFQFDGAKEGTVLGGAVRVEGLKLGDGVTIDMTSMREDQTRPFFHASGTAPDTGVVDFEISEVALPQGRLRVTIEVNQKVLETIDLQP